MVSKKDEEVSKKNGMSETTRHQSSSNDEEEPNLSSAGSRLTYDFRLSGDPPLPPTEIPMIVGKKSAAVSETPLIRHKVSNGWR